MINEGVDVTCYGCGVCAISCPKNIIKMSLSRDGFYVPFIDEKESCIECGICERVCSYLDDKILDIDKCDIKGYSAYNKDDTIRRNSTSGGIGIEIAREFNKIGYNLCGVEYDVESKIAKHFVATDLNEYEKSKGSKYIQSSTVDAFSKFERGQKYVVFGSPCQVDSLKRYVELKKWNSNFFFVDFFCHGVPSYNLWNKYIESLNKKGLFSKDTKVLFRDKINGWHDFTIGLYSNKATVHSKLTSNDLFLSMFLGNYCLNKTCYNCKFRLYNSAADIRIGDLWGKKYSNNSKGISGVISLTEKGHDLIDKIKDNCCIESEELEIVTEGQMKGNYTPPKKYDKIMECLRSKSPLRITYLRFGHLMIIKNIIPSKLKKIIKRILNK